MQIIPYENAYLFECVFFQCLYDSAKVHEMGRLDQHGIPPLQQGSPLFILLKAVQKILCRGKGMNTQMRVVPGCLPGKFLCQRPHRIQHIQASHLGAGTDFPVQLLGLIAQFPHIPEDSHSSAGGRGGIVPGSGCNCSE